MAAVTNGHSINGHVQSTHFERFSDVPAVIDIPVKGDDGDEAVNLDLTELLDETDELCDLLQTENAARHYWITIALAYVKQNKANIAIDILQRGLNALARGKPEDRLSVLTCLCWLYLWKCRSAPRVKPTQTTGDERTKDFFLHAATSTLNDASRINPSYPPLFLARGTLYILRASLQKSGSGPQEQSERAETLKQASKCFDDAYRVSGQKNVMAIMGKAKAQFSMGRYPEAYVLYQQALERAPDMIDPDPRIGIGCCLWQLGHKENAKEAWERSLALNESSKIANILLGLCYLDETSHYMTNDPTFAALYKKAMTTYTQMAFKLDDMHALSCATFGSYFLLRKTWPNVERLARRAIEHTDINAIASDGWYLLARKEHYEGNLALAENYYGKADQARGGEAKGYPPAKFGVAQLKTLMNDVDGAKFRLEKMISTNKSVEAMTLLGVLHAEDLFSNQRSATKEDKSTERTKAIALLEQVRVAWKDSKKRIAPDPTVLLNLARLYEADQPDKALACLQQVEQMELDEIPDDELPEGIEDEAAIRNAKRELLSPQLLNNIGCFHFQAEKLAIAREDFQAALRATVAIGVRDDSVDTDALVSTISYNLARTHEAEGMVSEAEEIYSSLLARHPDYVDAKARMAYIIWHKDHADGAEAIKQLLEADPGNLEIRSLYGWYIHHNKRRTLALNEDQEQRHYKHTLLTYDKHDIYSLTGMGNLHLLVAREMRRETDQDKERRSKTYMRAVEFFDKVLTLDPKNAFAAQGLAIALIEDKRDTSAAVQIFSRVRESIKDASVHLNLGHVFCELKQFSRAVENYELALAKTARGEGTDEATILACLGRAWQMRGMAERSPDALRTSLEFARRALATRPDDVHFRFNVAFVQIMIAQETTRQPAASRTLAEVDAASAGLDAAIEALTDIARSPNPPFPRDSLEQRANMGRNTMKGKLADEREKQAEYEASNATRLDEARRRRDEEMRQREADQAAAAAAAEADRRRLREERARMMEEDRLLVQRRLEEDKAREEAEMTTDEETGGRKKREKKPREKRAKRKKKSDESDSELDGGPGGSDGESAGAARSRKQRSRGASATGSDAEGPSRRKKKRRLARKGTAKPSKYKSAETVVESDDDGGGAGGRDPNDEADSPNGDLSDLPAADDDDLFGDEDGGDAPAASNRAQRKKAARVLDDDDEEDEDDAVAAGDSDQGGD